MNLARSTYYYQLKYRDRILDRERRDAELKELMRKWREKKPYDPRRDIS